MTGRAVHCELRRSWWLIGFETLCHGLALVSLGMVLQRSLPGPPAVFSPVLVVLLAIAVLINFHDVMRRCLLVAPEAVLALTANGEDYQLQRASGASEWRAMSAPALVFASLIILRLEGENLLLCRDAMSAGDFRRLKVWLRLAGSPPGSG